MKDFVLGIKMVILEFQALLVPAIFALFVLMFVTDVQSFKIGFAKLLAGLFCALVFTDPFLDWLGRDPEVYRTVTASMFAMIGHELMRTLASLNVEKLISLIQSVRGK